MQERRSVRSNWMARSKPVTDRIGNISIYLSLSIATWIITIVSGPGFAYYIGGGRRFEVVHRRFANSGHRRHRSLSPVVEVGRPRATCQWDGRVKGPYVGSFRDARHHGAAMIEKPNATPIPPAWHSISRLVLLTRRIAVEQSSDPDCGAARDR